MSSAPIRNLEERVRKMAPVSVPSQEQQEAAALARLLGRIAHVEKKGSRFRLVGPSGESIPIPPAVLHLLGHMVDILARGDALTLVPVGKTLTTQQAADILNVSRQYLVKILDEGRLPFTKTGKHRRLQIKDVLAFKKQRDAGRKAALDELTQLSEQIGGYTELE